MWVNQTELGGAPGVDDDKNGYADDVYGYNFVYENSDPADDHGHGTHCAGIIAAEGNNGSDIAGLCWNTKIMALKFLNWLGSGQLADAIPAFYYAVENGADVISNSWGGGFYMQSMQDAIDYAHSQGVRTYLHIQPIMSMLSPLPQPIPTTRKHLFPTTATGSI
jgi:subtilisin family serine protease